MEPTESNLQELVEKDVITKVEKKGLLDLSEENDVNIETTKDGIWVDIKKSDGEVIMARPEDSGKNPKSKDDYEIVKGKDNEEDEQKGYRRVDEANSLNESLRFLKNLSSS